MVEIRRLFQKLKPYGACALPFGVGLLSLAYLSVQSFTADWAVRSAPTPDPPAAVVKCVTAAPPPMLSPTPRPKPTPIVEFGHLLCAPDALTAEFGEALKVKGRQNYTVESWKQAVSASGLAAWRFTTGLVTVALLGAFIISFLIIWYAPRKALPRKSKSVLDIGTGGDDPPNILGKLRTLWAKLRRSVTLLCHSPALQALLWFLACGITFVTISELFFDVEKAAVIAGQYLKFIDAQLEGSHVWYAEKCLLIAGYVTVTYMLCASGATLLPFPLDGGAARQTEAARILAVKMRLLRLLLYVGAFVLAAGALRGRLNQDWALSYLPPLAALEGAAPEKLAASLIYERLKTIGSNTVTSVAFLNTLLIAAIYVPAALVLQSRADKLFEATARSSRSAKAENNAKSKKSVAAGKTVKPDANTNAKPVDDADNVPQLKREDWMKTYGLSFPLKDHLGRVAAILSPLLAGPLGDLLSFLKG